MNKQINPKLQELMAQAPAGKNPFYYAIGKLGGQATRDKYGNVGNVVTKNYRGY